MHVVLFVHSLVSCWNHGNAHFLRGVARALIACGHTVRAYEPADGWSRNNLRAEQGEAALARFRQRFPELETVCYDPANLDPELDRALDGADLVLVHEWNDPALVTRLGRRRARGARFRLLFHDTHHRALTRPDEMARCELGGYDGVLAFGAALAAIYERRGWARRVWVWHEAADTALFHPLPDRPPAGDLVWIGNWGDDERTAELARFLLRPVRRLGLRARVHGVRYPEGARAALAQAGLEYDGWLPNDAVPEVFARHRMTVHIPRRPYAQALPGIPTIRVFEALACGIPLVCAPWDDVEGLFRPGSDYLVARTSDEMTRHLAALRDDAALAAECARNGLATIRARHTCAHRVAALLAIARELGAEAPASSPSPEVPA